MSGIAVGGRQVDLSGRIYTSSTVIASPALAAETVVATTALVDGTLAYKIALVEATIAYTIGTSGTACTVQLRQGTTTAGSSIFTTGAQTGGHNSAALLVSDEVSAFDLTPATQYSVTLTVANGAATSTVSKVAIVVWYL